MLPIDKNRFRQGMRFLLFFVMALFALGALVMYLWNTILIEITSVKPISYPQAIGLLMLCRLLFGRMGQRPQAPFKPSTTDKEKLLSLSEEERNQFKNQWRKRCDKSN